VIIISPLKALQRDQRRRFRKMGVSAIDVNGDTWSPQMRKDLEDHKYQAILLGPEMCLEHEGFRDLFKSSSFTKNLVALVIDEAHCISQWGGDFRTSYSKLGELRSYVPTTVPILATSATLAPSALEEVRDKLHINPKKSFFVNLGNDRPNITPSVIQMRNASDYGALLELVVEGVSSPEDLAKTIIFTNSIQKTLEIQRFLRSHLPIRCYPYIDIFHAHRTARSKHHTLEHFYQGHIKLLVATEAAGMGADIPDIEVVIQFGVPSSLEVWTQRAGRAGRTANLQAKAILLVEKSMFQRKKPSHKKRKVDASDGGSSSDDSGVSDVDCDGGEVALVWGKVVDPSLREWIETPGCRRDITDNYFKNPGQQKGEYIKDHWTAVYQERLMVVLAQPLGDCCDPILPDPILTTLASNAKIRTVADMSTILTNRWVFMEKHGEEVIEVLREADDTFKEAAQRAR
ncbi:P-loop containing nucleoside triphosphate hydrolase protein, partial [Paxillus ammoniavirescens]